MITLKEQGYEGVGIWKDKLLDYGVEKAKELLDEVGLAVSSLQWAGGFTGDEHLRYEECIADAHEAIDIAAILEANCPSSIQVGVLVTLANIAASSFRKH